MITLELPTIDLGTLKTQIAWLNHPDAVRFSEQRHQKHTVNTQIAYIRSFLQHPHHILREIHSEGKMVGTITAYVDRRNLIADVGILIGAEHQKKGYGKLAWVKFCDTLFDNVGVRRVEAGCMVANIGMIKIFRHYGMSEEGVRPSHFMVEGVFSDLVLYGRFR